MSLLLSLLLFTATPVVDQDDLAAMNLAGDYYLTNDIALVGPWTPIGSFNTPFTGTFDGRGHMISGLAVVFVPPYADHGLFGGLAGAEVLRLHLEGFSFGSYRVGLLAGKATDSLIRDVHVSGATTATYYNGLMVGTMLRGQMLDCSASGQAGSVSAYAQYGHLGGLCGNVVAPALIERCSFVGNVETRYGPVIGGLNGTHYGDVIVRDCYVQATVSDHYENPSQIMGGILGSGPGHITRCYFVGVVQNGTMIGAVAGGASGLLIASSHWDSDVSGPLSACGSHPYCVGAEPHGSAAMHIAKTYPGWDFVHVWQEDLSGASYPTLRSWCSGDLDRDGVVGIVDLLALLAAGGTWDAVQALLDDWGPCL